MTGKRFYMQFRFNLKYCLKNGDNYIFAYRRWLKENYEFKYSDLLTGFILNR